MRLIPLLLAGLTLFGDSLQAQYRAEGIPLRSGDIERLNPARVVLDRRKTLKLERRQLDALDTLRLAFERDAKGLADSVRKYQRSITTAPPLLRRPPEEKPETRKDSLARAKLDSTNRMKRDKYFAEVTTGRRDLAATLLALKDLFDANVEKATDALSPDQKPAAMMALEVASEEFTRRLRLANIR